MNPSSAMPVERDNDAERLSRIEMLMEQYRVSLHDARHEPTGLRAASPAAGRMANEQLEDARTQHVNVRTGLQRKAR